MIGSLVAYLIVAATFLRYGWVVRAGLATGAVSLLPLFWQFTFTDSDAPGFVFLLMLTLPPALILIVVGSIICAFRWAIRFQQAHQSSAR